MNMDMQYEIVTALHGEADSTTNVASVLHLLFEWFANWLANDTTSFTNGFADGFANGFANGIASGNKLREWFYEWNCDRPSRELLTIGSAMRWLCF